MDLAVTDGAVKPDTATWAQQSYLNCLLGVSWAI